MSPTYCVTLHSFVVLPVLPVLDVLWTQWKSVRTDNTGTKNDETIALGPICSFLQERPPIA